MYLLFLCFVLLFDCVRFGYVLCIVSCVVVLCRSSFVLLLLSGMDVRVVPRFVVALFVAAGLVAAGGLFLISNVVIVVL